MVQIELSCGGTAEPVHAQEALTPMHGTAFIPKKLKIIMLGAGIAGITFAHDVATKMQNIDLEIYDKNPELGGTWFENRYPGCACDVPAHTYQFSWAPNPRWSRFYAPAPEILAYLKDVATKHDLYKYMHFRHRAVKAEWLEESSTWRVHLEVTHDDGTVETIVRDCDVLIQGLGTLNSWKWPDVAGLHSYKGKLLHTANWDDSFDFTGKKVAVIGNGASAVQCVAALQPVVGQLWNYVRTASWQLPHLFSDGVVQKEYTEEQISRFENDPEYYLEYRRQLENDLAGAFGALWRGTAAQKELLQITLDHMHKTIKNPKMLKALIPEFEIGCRRFTPGDHYLQAMQQSNAEMITDHIDRITETGILDKAGVLREVDAIVCATGFDASYEPRFPIIGREGYSLSENWGIDKTTESYMGACVARFPNHFAFNPPICPVIGSAFPGMEATSSYIIRVIDRLQRDCIKSLVVKDSAQSKFNEWAQSRMKEMAWSGNCKSWYKNSKGKVFIPWPGTIAHYVHASEWIRWEDFDFVWEDANNKYASFGNGIPAEGIAPEWAPWLKAPGVGSTKLSPVVANGVKVNGKRV